METIRAGNSETGDILQKITYYYDAAPDCSTASTNQVPVRGNLTRVVTYNNEGNDTETRSAFNNYGNPTCSRDANGNETSYIYDSTFSFLKTVTNALLQQVKTEYYGVDGVAADFGLYGQIKNVTDPNMLMSTTKYDSLGRAKERIMPDNSVTERFYPSPNDYGNVGTQHMKVTAGGLTTLTYFDGMGRTIKEIKTGPDGKDIVTEVSYDKRGKVTQKSLSYFLGASPIGYVSYTYDDSGRVTRVDYPDGTRTLDCYDDLVSVSIDADNRKKRVTKDARGNVVKVEEYMDSFTSCSTAAETPYTKTIYTYDPLDRIISVKDSKNNLTEIQYNSLGQKTSMDDPDMGICTYTYDGNGNLKTQTDAKEQTIRFEYDKLNRLTKKIYPDDKETVNVYDEPGTGHPKGKLTTSTDASGMVTKYFYDDINRIQEVTTKIDGNNYKVRTVSDELGRMKNLTYPDGEVVSYSYNGPVLKSVVGFAVFNNFNEVGLPKNVDYANNAQTSYDYDSLNYRLKTIKTTTPAAGNIIDVAYDYYNGGRVKSITDNLEDIPAPPIENLTLHYNHATKPHALTSISNDTNGPNFRNILYDENGNMENDGIRIINYNYDNMPTAINYQGVISNFVYDSNGNRIKKITPAGMTIYIGGLYECTESGCIKHIYAGSQRIALKNSMGAFYYHQDHQGSSRAITDSSGIIAERIYYGPFGAVISDSGGIRVKHKYTSQEYDEETGLYNYNARLYDPQLARFITADTVVPDPMSPASFNRYAYVQNDPLNYVDPSGHFWEQAVLMIIASVLYESSHNGGLTSENIFFGAVKGALSAAMFYAAGDAQFADASIYSHAAAGAISAGIDSGFDGQSMFIGALSAGLAEWSGGHFEGSHGEKLIKRTFIAGVAGGLASAYYGGSFEEGFMLGAKNGAYGYVFNEMAHESLTIIYNQIGRGTYNSSVLVMTDANTIIGTYEGSSLPNEGSNNPTVQAGTYSFSTDSHNSNLSGSYPALTLNKKGDVPTIGANPNNPTGASTANHINIHFGWNYSQRGSAGCLTVAPADWEGFISNFPSGSSGNVIILR